MNMRETFIFSYICISYCDVFPFLFFLSLFFCFPKCSANGVVKMATVSVDVFGEGFVAEMAPELEMENGREMRKNEEKEKIGK